MAMKTFSKAKVTMNGEVLLARDGLNFDPGGMERAVQKSLGRVDGFSESPMESKLEFDFTVVRGVSLAQIRDAVDVTLVIELDTGQTWVMRNAWCASPPTLTAGGSAAGKVTFNGPPAEEIL